MNPKIAAGIVLAIIAAVVVAVYLLYSQPTANKTSTQPVQTTSGKLYVYTARLEGGQALELLAYYIPLSSGTVYAQIYNNTASYFMVKNTGVINVLSQTLNSYQKATYYSKLLQICVNSTTTTTVAGERITLSNSQCQQSTSPLPTAKTFDELVLLIQGLPGPTSPSQWKQSGTAQTPYGQATVYTNTTEVPIMQGLSAILDYEKQQLLDGTIYQFKIKLSYGGQVAAILTYTLRNITTIPADVANVLNELSRDVVGTNGGGLDILRVAEKIGMKYDGNWPAAIVFFDLQCPYCAQLFKYNYTLFEGHRLVLVDLIVHPDALPAHERLRCLYNSTPQEVIPTLRVVYDRFLAGDQNYTSILPQNRCPIDANAGMQLATLIAGQNVGTPLVVVVYPNGTYTYVVGYDPASIAKALKG